MNLSFEKLTAYLQEQAGLDTSAITAETPLFTSNLLDSSSLVELIVYVESEMGVRIDPDDVQIENFDSISQILRFAEAKKNASGS